MPFVHLHLSYCVHCSSLLFSSSGTIAEGIAISKKHIIRRRVKSTAPKDARTFSCSTGNGGRYANAIKKTNFIALLSSHSRKRSVIGWGHRLRWWRCHIKSILLWLYYVMLTLMNAFSMYFRLFYSCKAHWNKATSIKSFNYDQMQSGTMWISFWNGAWLPKLQISWRK